MKVAVQGTDASATHVLAEPVVVDAAGQGAELGIIGTASLLAPAQSARSASAESRVIRCVSQLRTRFFGMSAHAAGLAQQANRDRFEFRWTNPQPCRLWEPDRQRRSRRINCWMVFGPIDHDAIGAPDID